MVGHVWDRFRKSLAKTRQSIQVYMQDLIDPDRRIEEADFERLEEMLISADVGVETSLRLVEAVRERTRTERPRDGESVIHWLADEVRRILKAHEGDWNLPFDRLNVLLFVGVNGSGKTTSVAKMAARLQGEGRRVVLAAADTFRAAAIDQLAVWADRLGVDLIRQKPGSDPAAVAYDAIQAAKARGADVVLVDTAGRLHSRINLMKELEKVYRVCGRAQEGAPHEVLLVMDATTGQNGFVQAREFTRAVHVTGIVLTKLDGSAKGGIVLAISDQLGIPVKWVGTGEGLDDLDRFSAEAFVRGMFGDSLLDGPPPVG